MLELDLEATSIFLDRAKSPEDVFGTVNGDVNERLALVKKSYHRIAKSVHPDRFNGTAMVDRANTVFASLNKWRDEAEEKIRKGSYGDYKPYVPAPAAPVFTPQTIKAGKNTYVTTSVISHGDIADLYACVGEMDGKNRYLALKVAQSAADNDLLENEARVLRAMYPLNQPSEKMYRYLPKFYDSFLMKGKGANRRVNIIERLDDNGFYSMAEVLAAFPGGLDYRDVVWMYKRLLVAIGFAHTQGVVHGAVIPTHVMVHPSAHGAKLVDWCYAVQDYKKGAGRVKAISKAYRGFYAPEILAKQAPTPATDIYMAAKCAVALLGGDVVTNVLPKAVPTPISVFLKACLLAPQSHRPDDAWALHDEFKGLLERVVGKPKYRPLTMPART